MKPSACQGSSIRVRPCLARPNTGPQEPPGSQRYPCSRPFRRNRKPEPQESWRLAVNSQRVTPGEPGPPGSHLAERRVHGVELCFPSCFWGPFSAVARCQATARRILSVLIRLVASAQGEADLPDSLNILFRTCKGPCWEEPPRRPSGTGLANKGAERRQKCAVYSLAGLSNPRGRTVA